MLQTISATRIKFGGQVFFTSALLAILSSYLLSFSLVGIFLSWVPSPEMWWPSKLLDVVFFRTWHKKLDDGSRGGMTNKKFFTIVFFVAILFHIPGFFLSFCGDYFFSLLAVGTAIGVWDKWVRSFIAQFWLAFSVRFQFSIFSRELFDVSGERYNLTRVLNQDGVSLNEKAYADYSPIQFTAFAIASYCVMFSAVEQLLSRGGELRKVMENGCWAPNLGHN